MWLMLSVAAFVTSILVHAAAVRLVPRAGAVPAFVAVGGAIGIALIGYCALSYGFGTTDPCRNSGLCFCLRALYFSFYPGGEQRIVRPAHQAREPSTQT